jgi:hypothetical protein
MDANGLDCASPTDPGIEPWCHPSGILAAQHADSTTGGHADDGHGVRIEGVVGLAKQLYGR